jgi:hypothetical protein
MPEWNLANCSVARNMEREMDSSVGAAEPRKQVADSYWGDVLLRAIEGPDSTTCRLGMGDQ